MDIEKFEKLYIENPKDDLVYEEIVAANRRINNYSHAIKLFRLNKAHIRELLKKLFFTYYEIRWDGLHDIYEVGNHVMGYFKYVIVDDERINFTVDNDLLAYKLLSGMLDDEYFWDVSYMRVLEHLKDSLIRKKYDLGKMDYVSVELPIGAREGEVDNTRKHKANAVLYKLRSYLQHRDMLDLVQVARCQFPEKVFEFIFDSLIIE